MGYPLGEPFFSVCGYLCGQTQIQKFKSARKVLKYKKNPAFPTGKTGLSGAAGRIRTADLILTKGVNQTFSPNNRPKTKNFGVQSDFCGVKKFAGGGPRPPVFSCHFPQGYARYTRHDTCTKRHKIKNLCKTDKISSENQESLANIEINFYLTFPVGAKTCFFF